MYFLYTTDSSVSSFCILKYKGTINKLIIYKKFYVLFENARIKYKIRRNLLTF